MLGRATNGFSFSGGPRLTYIHMLQMHDIDCDWVFAYGSLIWSPDIEFAERRAARLYGYHRAFCISSTRYRGTAEKPGAVLGLDRGGSCMGVAYRFKPSSRQIALTELFKREMPDPKSSVYRPNIVQLVLGAPCSSSEPCPPEESDREAFDDSTSSAVGERVQALTFLADRKLPSYIHLDLDQLVERLAGCLGERGPNRDYAINTWKSLLEMGFEDRKLTQVVKRLRNVTVQS
jgi:glutathione-specific gamma-glutamylcyclotransferase